MSIILHITYRKNWEAATINRYYTPLSLDTDGYIHCSTIEQTEEIANRFFVNQRNLVLLVVNSEELESPLKFEPSSNEDDCDSGIKFPHIYGPLNVSAVIRVIEFLPDPNGKFVLPEEIRQLPGIL